MVSLPTLDIPTAILAVLLSLIGGAIINRIQRWRRNVSQAKEEKRDWYHEVIRIVRETQMDIASAQAAKTGFEQTHPQTEEEALEILKENLENEGFDIEGKSDDEIRDMFEEDDLQQAVAQRVNEATGDYKEKVDEEIQQNLRSHYAELKTHMASRTFQFNQDEFTEFEQFLELTYTSSLFPGLSREDADEIIKKGDRLKKVCDLRIEDL